MSALDKLMDEIIEEAAAKAAKLVLEQLGQVSRPDRTMDVDEAAKFLGIDAKTVYRLCTEKRLPHIRLGQLNSKRPRILFRQSTLDRWMREQEEASIQKEVNTA